MRVHEIELAEQKLNRLAGMALYHQGAWLFLLALLLAFNPYYLKDAGQCLAMSALLSSFIVSRIYIHTGKKVEEFKKFTPDEAEERKREYMFRFFSPYFLWCGCMAIFSCV